MTTFYVPLVNSDLWCTVQSSFAKWICIIKEADDDQLKVTSAFALLIVTKTFRPVESEILPINSNQSLNGFWWLIPSVLMISLPRRNWKFRSTFAKKNEQSWIFWVYHDDDLANNDIGNMKQDGVNFLPLSSQFLQSFPASASFSSPLPSFSMFQNNFFHRHHFHRR